MNKDNFTERELEIVEVVNRALIEFSKDWLSQKKSSSTIPEWLRAKEVSEHFRIPESTVKSWASKGLITKYKLIGVVLYSFEEISSLIEAQDV